MKKSTVITGISCDCEECKRIYGFDGYEESIEDDRDLFYVAIMEQTVLDEGTFSWKSCDNCNCHLGGTRYIAHRLIGLTINEDNQIADKFEHISICVDCLFLIETGEYPADYIPCS